MTRTYTLTSFKNTCSLAVLAVALCGAGAANAGALPGHGHYVAGQGSIAKSGQVLTIDQSSRTGIINWKTFSVGKGNSVVFDNAHGATLNRVTGGNMSRIAGALHGTGSVYLINNSGVAVLPTGRIVTQGSFAASSNGADGDGFGARKRLLFTGGVSGNVVNQGRITSVNGRVDLSGHNVTDSGAIAARNASILAANTARVPGRIEASAVNGRGGHIETSGKHVAFAGAHITGASWLVDPKDLRVNAPAASTISSSLNHGTNVTLKTTATGTSGPGVASSGPGDISIIAPIAWTGAAKLTLSAYHSVKVYRLVQAKNKGDVTITTAHGGDLSFTAAGAITFGALTSSLNINGDAYTLEKTISGLKSGIAAHPGRNFALANNVNLGGQVYSTSPIEASSFTGTFEGLGHTISNLTIRDQSDGEVGLFDYMSNANTLRDINLSNVDVVGLSDDAYVGGLVGYTYGDIINVTVSGKVRGGYGGYTGGVTGWSETLINNAISTARVSSGDEGYAGGVIGYDEGALIENSSASGAVTGGFYAHIGGLVGYMDSSSVVKSSKASGNVNADYYPDAGGLVGWNDGGKIMSSSASGDVNGGYGYSAGDGGTGGLVGFSNNGSITGSHASGAVFADDKSYAGGLVGYNSGTSINTSHASGDVNGGYYTDAGGLVGYNEDDTGIASITNSYATGRVTVGAYGYGGGLVGANYTSARITNAYATGNVSGGYETEVGGLIGYDDGNGVSNSHATGNVTAGNESYTGGLIGLSSETVRNSYATGNVTGGSNNYTGGLVGYLSGGTIIGSHATGHVFGEYYYVGGLVGYSSGGTIKTSYATGDVDGTEESYVGGLVGANDSSSVISQSFATGDVTADFAYYAGGLVGKNDGVIGNSYARGDASGYDADVGGLAGFNSTSGTIKSSYSTGYVSGDGTSAVGGFIGDNENTTLADFATDYWNKNTSGTNTGIGAETTSVPAVKGRTTAQLTSGLLDGFSSSIWKISAGVNNGLPYLKANRPN